MNRFDETMYRVFARHLGRAVTVRTSSALSADPALTIGIATIKIVTEEHLQALAFGRLDGEPEVVVRLDPIGRDVGDLAPFADFIDRTAKAATEAAGSLRIWVPHAATLEALDVLGHRYWSNQSAPAAVQRMGEICRIIAHEAIIPGQQIVADASATLKAHMVTGLAPIEEGHLDAQIAWCDPTVLDPVVAARERIRFPASGVLPNTPDRPWDDRVDRLRKEAKGATGARRTALQAEISNLLRQAVLREWCLLVEGRRAFLSLHLPASGLDDLVRDSSDRIAYALANGYFPARQPHRLAIELAQKEAGLEKAALVALEADAVIREQARRAGAVVAGVVSQVQQARPGSHPCTITVDSGQGVIRFRPDDKVKVVGVNVTGIVRSLSAAPGGGTRVEIQIERGVRQRAILTVGTILEVTRQGYGFVNHRAFSAVNDRKPWIFYSDATPAIGGVSGDRRSALVIAAEARRS